MKQRNQTIDLAKGIAIVLMVIGHCYCSENAVLVTIYAFHMPAFFILSGLVYAKKWKSRIEFNLGLLCRRMLVPYLFFDALFSLFIIILAQSGNIFPQFINSLLRQVISLKGVTATWFLPCQLLLLCIFVLIEKYIPHKLRIIIYFILFVLGVCLLEADILVPIRRSLIGAGFFALGFHGSFIFDKKAHYISILAAGILFLLLSGKNGMVTLVGLHFSNPVLYAVNGFLGTYVLYQICLRIPENPFQKSMTFFGKNTIVILCTHTFFVECVRLIDYKLFDNVLNKLGIFEGFVFGGMITVFMIPTIKICNRFLRVLFGK
jgi:fucose 4-O-acetylase-like acetyltransferase